MARYRDLRDGTVAQPFDEYTVKMDDGSIKTYQVARQPMPKPNSSRIGEPLTSGFIQAVTKRVSKHINGWMPPQSKEVRQSKHKLRLAIRKNNRD